MRTFTIVFILMRISCSKITAAARVIPFAGILILPAALANAPSAVAGPVELAALDSKDANTPPVIQGGVLIGRIQRRLGEIGLYTGPADGVNGPETAAAIRAYQKQTRQPVDGRATRSLLDHLNSAAQQAKRLRRRLEDIKDRQIEAARKALNTDPRIRELLENSRAGDAIGKSPSALSVCPDPITSTCLIQEALLATRAVKKTELRDWALLRLAGARALEGNVLAALGIAVRISDARMVMNAMARIAKAQALGGRLDLALDTTAAIPDYRLRAEAYLSIAKNQSAADDGAAVRDTLVRALSATRNISDTRYQVPLMIRAAAMQANGGYGDDAKRNIAAALTLAKKSRFSMDRDRILSHVASAQARLGLIPDALETTAAIQLPQYSSQALSLVAGFQALDGSVIKALATVEAIQEAHLRATTLANIAVAQTRAGDVDGGGRTLDNALKEMEGVRPGYSFDYAQSVVAEAASELNQWPKAIKLAARVDDGLLRVRAMWNISESQIRIGNPDTARRAKAKSTETARSIKNGLERSWALSDIALGWQAANNPAKALSTLNEALREARTLRSSWYRARALTRVAETLTALTGSFVQTVDGKSTRLGNRGTFCIVCQP